jgi:hypothetical protein
MKSSNQNYNMSLIEEEEDGLLSQEGGVNNLDNDEVTSTAHKFN